MDRRTIGIIATVVTALCCGCSGLSMCLWGALAAAGLGTFTTELGDMTQTGSVPMGVGLAVMCLGIIFIAIPIVVGFVTLRKPKEAVSASFGEPLPPAS